MSRSARLLFPMLAFLVMLFGMPITGSGTAEASSALYGSPQGRAYVYVPGYEPVRAAPRKFKRQRHAKNRQQLRRDLAGVPRKARSQAERRRIAQRMKARQIQARQVEARRLAARNAARRQIGDPAREQSFDRESRYPRRYASLGDGREQRVARDAASSVEARVDIRTQRMIVKVDGEVRHTWKVSTGRHGYATPRGQYRPGRMHASYFSRKYYNSPMPYSIFFRGGYAIHGTTAVGRLGGPASHGCVRLATANARALFNLVKSAGAHRTRIVIS